MAGRYPLNPEEKSGHSVFTEGIVRRSQFPRLQSGLAIRRTLRWAGGMYTGVFIYPKWKRKIGGLPIGYASRCAEVRGTALPFCFLTQPPPPYISFLIAGRNPLIRDLFPFVPPELLPYGLLDELWNGGGPLSLVRLEVCSNPIDH
ncbi:MAG TPA: hypothetical protein VMV49_17995 [Candidatus Deferrimicrobium sp.]|nr:hypothetical protein [Candidatus Deferrimicrobium sp.]